MGWDEVWMSQTTAGSSMANGKDAAGMVLMPQSLQKVLGGWEQFAAPEAAGKRAELKTLVMCFRLSRCHACCQSERVEKLAGQLLEGAALGGGGNELAYIVQAQCRYPCQPLAVPGCMSGSIVLLCSGVLFGDQLGPPCCWPDISTL